MTTRRDFLKSSAASAIAAGALGAANTPLLAATDAASRATRPLPGRARASLNMLILGGTGFTGPEQVEYALARGHRVTLLNRNRTRPDFFKGKIDQIIGDLSSDVSGLQGKQWDVVIDNPTTFPAWVRNAAQYLKGNTNHYIYISTVSVYHDDKTANADESAPTTPMPPDVDPYTLVPANGGKYYSALKSYSEKEVEKHYPGINTIIRPGLIVGPLDRSDRFTYWPQRIDAGGEVLAPGTGNDAVQIIDARDIAEWTIRMAENRTLGTFNAVGPRSPMTMAEMLYGIKAITSSAVHFIWVPESFLAEQKVEAWSDLPVWSPDSTGDVGASRRNIDKAVAAGLTFRPLAVTAKDTLDWNKTRRAAELKIQADAKRSGITRAREAAVLAAWKARAK